jgi:hypothetical protein
MLEGFDTFAVAFDVDGHPVDTADKTGALRFEEKSYQEVCERKPHSTVW